MRSVGKIAYDSVRTPIGEVHIAAGPWGVVAIGLGGTPSRFVQDVAKRSGMLPEKRRGAAGAAARQVNDYLRGRRRTFRLPVDTRGLTDFQRAVLRAASRIPYGRTISYGEIARGLRRPLAARAVGQALGANPLPLLIPCHRVVGARGALGGYSAARGVSVKRWLLRLEGARSA
jgi:methylated-DNA-[protein]-cysteine S-methyltransferase